MISEKDLKRIIEQPGYGIVYGEAVKDSSKRNKFGNVRCEYDGLRFDSKAEMIRYGELRLLEITGAITDLEVQPVYLLTAGVKYRGDFRYIEKGGVVVEDVKGGSATATPLFRVKWKQAKELYPDVDFRMIER